MMKGAIGAVLLLVSLPAAAHGPGADASVDLGIPVALATLALLYAAGYARLRARRPRRPLARSAALFLLGLAILAASLLGPLHEGGRHSFTLHMLEHELMMLAAAPLLALAHPVAMFAWALPAAWRGRAAAGLLWRAVARLLRRLGDPVVATILQTLALWLWHAPVLFGLALRHEGWHAAQHASFLLTAIIFWWSMVRCARSRGGALVAALCLFATSVQSGVLGALMTFAAGPWYGVYAAQSPPWGLSPLQDQQLAGLLMWIPGGALHALVALVLLRRLFRVPAAA